MDIPVEFAKLNPVAAEHAKTVETGMATSAVVLAFSCGHWFQRINGDCLYATCPLCYIYNLVSKR